MTVGRGFRQAWGSSAWRSAEGDPLAGTEGTDASLPSEAPGIEPSCQMDVVADDGVSCSDDETAWEETLAFPTESSSSSRRRRARRGKLKKVSSDGPPAKSTYPANTSVPMAFCLESAESQLFRSHREVWEDQLSWEEIRAMKLSQGASSSQGPSWNAGCRVACGAGLSSCCVRRFTGRSRSAPRCRGRDPLSFGGFGCRC